MGVRRRKVIKNLISISPNVEEADKIITENYNFKTIGEKIAFLRGMFDVQIVSKYDGDEVTEEESAKMDYLAMLDTIIKT